MCVCVCRGLAGVCVRVCARESEREIERLSGVCVCVCVCVCMRVCVHTRSGSASSSSALHPFDTFAVLSTAKATKATTEYGERITTDRWSVQNRSLQWLAGSQGAGVDLSRNGHVNSSSSAVCFGSSSLSSSSCNSSSSISSLYTSWIVCRV